MKKIGLLEVLNLLALMLSASVFGAELVSVNDEGTDGGTLASSARSISGDGRYVVFVSRSRDLVRGISFSGTQNVFVRDLLLNTNRVVSINRLNTAGANEDSYDPVISRNGRFVVFVSTANDLVEADMRGNANVYVRDLLLETTRLVSISRDGAVAGDGPSGSPSISASGRFIAFTSLASDLVRNLSDGNAADDVFTRDQDTATTLLVSVNRLGLGSGNAASFHPVISQDGANVAFVSRATDLTFTSDGNNAPDVFLRTLPTAVTRLISVTRLGNAAGNGTSDDPALDFTGSTVVFTSTANDLVFGDNNGVADVFARRVSANQNILVSVNRLGNTSASGPSSDGGINDAGTIVAFQSDASDIVFFDENNAPDVFARQLASPTCTVISINYFGTRTGDGPSTRPVISANGAAVAFQSLADDLVVNDNNHLSDVFLRVLSARTNVLASVDRLGVTSGFGSSSNPFINAAGTVVAFDSFARDLSVRQPSFVPQVYAFLLPTSGLGPFVPLLTVQSLRDSVVVSWNANLEGFRLESRPIGRSSWSPMNVTPTVVRGRNVVTNDLVDGARLFRLAKP